MSELLRQLPRRRRSRCGPCAAAATAAAHLHALSKRPDLAREKMHSTPPPRCRGGGAAGVSRPLMAGALYRQARWPHEILALRRRRRAVIWIRRWLMLHARRWPLPPAASSSRRHEALLSTFRVGSGRCDGTLHQTVRSRSVPRKSCAHATPLRLDVCCVSAG